MTKRASFLSAISSQNGVWRKDPFYWELDLRILRVFSFRGSRVGGTGVEFLMFGATWYPWGFFARIGQREIGLRWDHGGIPQNRTKYKLSLNYNGGYKRRRWRFP